ncbi:MAG: PUA domain-containing protein [Promethearchaeota archaeon]
MIESSNFRKINEIENKIISESLAKISPQILKSLKQSKKELYIVIIESKFKTNYPKIFLVSDDFLKNIDLNGYKDKIYSINLYFGFIKKSSFYLSLEGAEFLYKQGNLSDLNHIYLNEKGEKSVLYGNNILKKMVVNTSSNLKKGDFLLVFNEADEILAIAQSKVDILTLKHCKSNEIIAINLSDKGIYLREKQ